MIVQRNKEALFGCVVKISSPTDLTAVLREGKKSRPGYDGLKPKVCEKCKASRLGFMAFCEHLEIKQVQTGP